MPRPALKKQFEIVGAHAQRGADAEVPTLFQIANQPFAVPAQVHMGVDDRRHHRLAGEIDARGAGRDGHALAGLHDLVAVDDQRRVLNDAAVADDEPHVLERRDISPRRTS